MRGQTSRFRDLASRIFATESTGNTEDTATNGELRNALRSLQCGPGGTCPPHPLGVLVLPGGYPESLPSRRPCITRQPTASPAPGEAARSAGEGGARVARRWSSRHLTAAVFHAQS